MGLRGILLNMPLEQRLSYDTQFLNEHLPGGKTILMTAVCTIIKGVIARGLSADPLVSLLVSRLRTGVKGE
ncbi:MAG: hypothetical protein AB7U29_16195 [Desulfobulbus sp.]